MQTKILKAKQIDEVVSLLKNGCLVAMPTETVYGLAADAKNEEAIQKIFQVKERPCDHPLILHISSYEEISYWAKDLSKAVKILATNFWPGPLTMVLKKQNHVSDIITGGLNTIAIRMPKNPLTLEVINKLGNAIVAPSANAHKKISPTKPSHVLKTLDGKISAILDDGMSFIGIESTIIDMTKEIPAILRYGAITKQHLEEALQLEISCPSKHNEKVSGNMENHYQPDKPLILVSTEQIERLSSEDHKIAIMHYSMLAKNDNFVYYQMPKDKTKYAKNLYHALHELDSMKVDKIFVEIPPDLIEWRDVIDRLVKASAK